MNTLNHKYPLQISSATFSMQICCQFLYLYPGASSAKYHSCWITAATADNKGFPNSRGLSECHVDGVSFSISRGDYPGMWGQCIWRKIQDPDIGLATAYKRDSGTHKLCRKIMALPYLPHEHTHQLRQVDIDRRHSMPARILVRIHAACQNQQQRRGLARGPQQSCSTWKSHLLPADPPAEGRGW